MGDDVLARAASALAGASSVALACHVNPDADALGSMLGLSTYLRGRGIATTCSYPNEPFEPPRWLELLPGRDALVPPREFPKRPELLVTCDVASLD
ncbi:MAG: DHH family phosphoesterase, partial [Actinomycetota bacterium]